MTTTDGEGHYSEKLIGLAILVSLLVGIAIYNVIPISGGEDGALAPAAAVTGGESSTAAAVVPTTVVDAVNSILDGSASGGSFGSGVAALQSGATADELVGSGQGSTTVDTPAPPAVPAPACPTDQANDAYDSVAGPVGDALGQSLPADNLRVLAEIAAGCSAEPATTPLIGLALDITRLLPDTGIEPVDLSAIPAVETPALPAELIAALDPVKAPIQEACGNVGLLGVLMAVFPSAAHVPVDGNDLSDVIVPAQTLCAQFEG
jgi:hypothetical protein